MGPSPPALASAGTPSPVCGLCALGSEAHRVRAQGIPAHLQKVEPAFRHPTVTLLHIHTHKFMWVTGPWVNFSYLSFAFCIFHFFRDLRYFLDGKLKKQTPLFVCEANKQALTVPSGTPHLSGTVRQPSPDHRSLEHLPSIRKECYSFRDRPGQGRKVASSPQAHPSPWVPSALS